MPFHHPSTHTLSKALCSARTLPAYLAVAAILSIALPSGGFPVEMMVFRADVGVKVVIVFEAVFPVGIRFMRVPSMADDALDSLRFQQMCDPCIMITRVQSHVSGQLPQSLLCFVQDFRKWRDVVDVGRLDMYVDDYIPLAVHRPVLAVMEALRLSFPALLPTLRVGGALHPRGRSAAPVIFIVPVKAFLLQHLPIPLDLHTRSRVICLRRLFYRYQLLLVFARLRLDVR